ncbi:MAG: D-hexose-6-phosphate mutarotase, partial [Lentisphaerae bacterium]|nr:D-hexose-6-phosphate mutarotase [Lentisphaerota bacterium]
MTGQEELNVKYSIPGKIEFIAGNGGFINAVLRNGASECIVSLYGGHVMSYKPEGKDDLLWMSKSSYFEEGRPIRGGIPVCWPWFGGHHSGSEMPSHGFARISQWNVKSVSDGKSFTELVLSLTDKDISDKRFMTQPFELELSVKCGKKLEVCLSTVNSGKNDFKLTEALHSYFSVFDIKKVSVSGLDGAGYVETAGGIRENRIQSGDILFSSEVDRLYSGSVCDCVISDPGLGRKIRISKQGSKTTVVWNPW